MHMFLDENDEICKEFRTRSGMLMKSKNKSHK
jgi:hypothetical protein